MLSFDPKNQTVRENYKLLIGTVIPRPIAFVTSVAEDGTINGAPFSFFNVASSHPPMLSVAVQRTNGVQKDTARNILAKKEFVIHVVDGKNVEKINETAATLPPDESEVEKENFTLVPSDEISVPGIKEAKVRFECVLETCVPLREGERISSDFIIGRVVKFHVDKEIYDAQSGRINEKKLGAVSRLAGTNYAHIGDVFSLQRPK